MNIEEKGRAARAALIDVVRSTDSGDAIDELVRVRQAFDLRERFHEAFVVERSEPDAA